MHCSGYLHHADGVTLFRSNWIDPGMDANVEHVNEVQHDTTGQRDDHDDQLLTTQQVPQCSFAPEPPDAASHESDSSQELVDNGASRLFACYLLVSKLASTKRRSSSRTYIGFTVNPSRRLRQHNGQIRYGGAYRTRRGRPWENVAVIHGFTSKTHAMQFEWAWQNPLRSLTLKMHSHDKYTLPSTSRNSTQGALQTLAALVAVPPWSRCPLTLTICSPREEWKIYGIDKVSLPPHLRVTFSPLQSFDRCLTSYDFRQPCDYVMPRSPSSTCLFCNTNLYETNRKLSYCTNCGHIGHLHCFAQSRSKETQSVPDMSSQPDALVDEPFLPTNVFCGACKTSVHWSLVVRLSHALTAED